MKNHTFLLIFGLSLTAINLCYGGWVIQRPMPHARYGAFVATVNNKLYVIGGLVNQNTAVSYNEVYDPVNDTWISRVPMPFARGLGVCAVVNNKIYCIGGVRARIPVESVDVYDPELNQWQRRRRVPIRHMGFNGGVIGDSIYVCSGNFPNTMYTDTVIVYNTVRDSWFVRHSMNVARSEFGCAVVNNRLYAIGGLFYSSYPTITEEYTPSEDTWRIKASLPLGRSGLVCAPLDNYIYTIGGERHVAGHGRTIYNRVDIYNSITNAWSIGESLNIARSFAGAAQLNNRIYVVGGIGRNFSSIATLEEYISTGIEETNNQIVYLPKLTVSPNPLRHQTILRFFSTSGKNAIIKIYNNSGYLVKTFKINKVNGYIIWDGIDDNQRQLPAGIYFAEVVNKTSPKSPLTKIVILR